MKVHKNQRVVGLLSPPDIPCGGTNQGTPHGVWGADACAGPCYGTIPREVRLQALENKVLSRGIRGKSAPILAEITIRKSQTNTALKYSDLSCLVFRFTIDAQV